MDFFLLASGNEIFISLERYFRYVHKLHLNRIPYHRTRSQATFISQFKIIINELETKTNRLRNTVVFIDPDILQDDHLSSTDLLSALNPLINSVGAIQLLSMLILAAPEIHWIFLPGINLYEDDKPTFNKNFHTFTIENLNKFCEKMIDFAVTDLVPLFDPSHLRNHIKRNIQKDEKGIPARRFCAAAIDEEISYALMNGYTAFRFGYRVWPITSLKVMEYIFRDQLEMDCQVKLIFEDLYLNFPDKPRDYHLSKLSFRDTEFSKLKEVEDRILVTVGHRKDIHTGDEWQENVGYLKSSITAKSKILFKPFSGIFDLWKNSGKWNLFKDTPKLEEGFIWPPRKVAKLRDEESSHSAPGRLLIICESLLKRAENLLTHAESVEDTIQAATLAMEAKEILGCKTPTTALQALSLQHQAEVEAECRFYGVEYDFDVKSRIKDIKEEVKAISSWFHHSAKKRSQLNAEINILLNLASCYRKYGQFDEESVCLNEVRKLTTTLAVIRKPIRTLVWPFRIYINYLLQSLGRFFFIILLWIFLFGCIYYSIAHKKNVSFIDSIIVSAETFLSFQPPDTDFWLPNNDQKNNKVETELVDDKSDKIKILFFQSPIRLWLFIIPAILGFIHLGVFISHLYIILMRRPGG